MQDACFCRVSLYRPSEKEAKTLSLWSKKSILRRWHSTTGARKRRAPHNKNLISGGCLNAALQARSEFRRTAVGRRAFWFLFVAHKKELARRGETRPLQATTQQKQKQHQKK
jgi:hypothetical protein